MLKKQEKQSEEEIPRIEISDLGRHSESEIDSLIKEDLVRRKLLRDVFCFFWQRIVQEKENFIFVNELAVALKVSGRYARDFLNDSVTVYHIAEKKQGIGNIDKYFLKKDDTGDYIIRKYMKRAYELVQIRKGEKV